MDVDDDDMIMTLMMMMMFMMMIMTTVSLRLYAECSYLYPEEGPVGRV